MEKSQVARYWRQYKWSNVYAMLKNMREKPKVCEQSFSGRLVAITGATSGVGYHTARKYAAMGARVVMINRNAEKSERIKRELEEEFGAKAEYALADLSLLAGMQAAGRYLAGLSEPIDALIHNAGLHLTRRTVTADGLEANFAVHYLAPFVINAMLMDKFRRDRRGRVVFVSSEGYRFAAWGLCLDDLQWERRRYSGLKGYGAAKLAQLLSMHDLAAELSPHVVTVNAMHPGMVRTNTGRDNGRLYKWYKRKFLDSKAPTPEISAEALYYLGAAPELETASDTFYHLTAEEELAPPARDLEAGKALKLRTLEILRDKGIDA